MPAVMQKISQSMDNKRQSKKLLKSFRSSFLFADSQSTALLSLYMSLCVSVGVTSLLFSFVHDDGLVLGVSGGCLLFQKCLVGSRGL